jgi:hypothetical protein
MSFISSSCYLIDSLYFLFALFNFTMQFDSEDGVIAAVTPGKVIIDCATLSPERMQFESLQIQER